MNSEKPTEIPILRGPVPLAHLILRNFVQPGSRVIDATCGNGYDTLLLAELAGADGMVWAFDIQAEAIQATAEKLAKSGLAERVRLIHAGHETLAAQIPAPVNAIVFNLGYRPGGDRSIITRSDTTRSALAQALTLLARGGILAITVYPGHSGGEGEGRMLDEWAAALPQKAFHAWRMAQTNTPADAPLFILIQKAK